MTQKAFFKFFTGKLIPILLLMLAALNGAAQQQNQQSPENLY